MITITNDFHNTEARVRGLELSPATVRRVRRELCGISDCTCGGVLGQRGRQEVEIEPNEDGSVTLHEI